MSSHTLLYFAVSVWFTLYGGLATTSCYIKDQIDCTYTITCEIHPGTAPNPPCDAEPNVTFIMTKSHTAFIISSGFFSPTNFDSRVRTLRAFDNTWQTIEAFSFRYYTKTINLDLSNNKIVNLKNEAFRNLMLVERLNLSQNDIESLNPKSFYISETKISLTVLDLSDNLITTLPSEPFSYLPNLKLLYLQRNKITTIADDCLNNLKNLQILWLQNNFITSLSVTLVNLKELTELDISFNFLTKLSGYETNRLMSMKKFNISYNALKTVESNCFNQAFNLETADFRCNNLNSTIENVLFINNNKLQYLNFYNNSITRIQENAFKHNTLSYLNLEKNNISGEVAENTFSGLYNVTSLDLSKQNIKVIQNRVFSDTTYLAQLNLSRNVIDDIENFAFSGAVSLTILDLSYNNLSTIGFIKTSSDHLTELYLNNNNIETMQNNLFSNKTQLIKLDISMNKITIIEPFSLPLNKLQYLNIVGNKLSNTIKANVFSPAKFLRYLDLSSFNISIIDYGAFVDLPVLARLNLSHNQIKSIDSKHFKGVDNIYSLDLSYNELSHLELDVKALRSVKAVYLNNNKLDNVTKIFSNTSNILYLDLSYNEISDISDNVFKFLPDLKVLHLSRNKITTFNNGYTNSLIKLNTLRISANQLKDINLSYFKELVIVDLSNNSFNYINSTLFQNLDYLQSLDISNNEISDLMPGTFQYVKILKLLNLSSNGLTTLRYGSLKGLNRTEVIDISKNKIVELDVNVFHECNELRKLIIDYNFVKTLDVPRLITIVPTLKTLSLGGNPISCKEIYGNIVHVNEVHKKSSEQLEVTSLDKIYHVDNVHGIMCGNTNHSQDITKDEISTKLETKQSYSMSTILLIWCTVLTTIAILMGAFYLYKRNKFNNESRLQLRSSLELNGSEQNDLLS